MSHLLRGAIAVCGALSILPARGAHAASDLMHPGTTFHDIRDYREVMPGALYRGGANNGHAPLTTAQLDALCDAGMGTAIYLYTTGFRGPATVHCARGSLEYIYDGWEGGGRAAVHRKIYDTIKQGGPPVFHPLLERDPRDGCRRRDRVGAVLRPLDPAGRGLLEGRRRPRGAVSKGDPEHHGLPPGSAAHAHAGGAGEVLPDASTVLTTRGLASR
jgi:hypothetical protein